jgi:D-alanyl-D-alanine carboxypeptidase
VNNGKIVLPTNTRPAPDDVYGTEAVPTSAPAHSSVDSISTGASTTTTATAPKQTVAPQKPSTAQQNPTSISEPTTIDGVIIVNKSYALPSTYNPNKLSTETQKAFDEMNAVAKSKGLSLWIASGFRSYESQKSIYERNLAAYGQAKTDTFSARPGFSEHQTGLAFDLNTIDDSFAYTSEGVWVVANAHKYGFIIRYPKDKEHITGYKYEPWHLRYVGKELAQTLYNRDQTLEEYFNITSVYANAEYKSN